MNNGYSLSRRALWLLLFLVGAGQSTMAAEPSAAPVVKLVVDYGDGVSKHFTELPWKQGMTVFDALRLAAAHRHGIQFESRGSGETLFVTRIDDLTNEGRGKNWVFRVNDKLAEASCAVSNLGPGDSVLWKFEVYR